MEEYDNELLNRISISIYFVLVFTLFPIYYHINAAFFPLLKLVSGLSMILLFSAYNEIKVEIDEERKMHVLLLFILLLVLLVLLVSYVLLI